MGLLSLGDEFNLYECTLGQVLNGKSAAGRERSREELGVNLVHGAEVGDVTEEYSRLDHIFQVKSLALKDGASVEQTLAGLFLDSSLGEGSGLGDDGQLARNKDDVTSADCLAVGANGSGCLVGV